MISIQREPNAPLNRVENAYKPLYATDQPSDADEVCRQFFHSVFAVPDNLQCRIMYMYCMSSILFKFAARVVVAHWRCIVLQLVVRKFRSILNKLTPQKFDKLVDQMLKLPIDSELRLKRCIDTIFEKVRLSCKHNENIMHKGEARY